jgi:hypothetical protein
MTFSTASTGTVERPSAAGLGMLQSPFAAALRIAQVGLYTQQNMAHKPKLLDQVRHKHRLKHYSIHTEQAYVDWMPRVILVYHRRHPVSLGASEVEAFLTYFAVEHRVCASRQRQALVRSRLGSCAVPKPSCCKSTVGTSEKECVVTSAFLTPHRRHLSMGVMSREASKARARAALANRPCPVLARGAWASGFSTRFQGNRRLAGDIHHKQPQTMIRRRNDRCRQADVTRFEPCAR